MIDTRLKKRIQEGITNVANLGLIPADEAQLNLDVLYDSILPEICSVVPMESPRQIISCLQLTYGSENKSQLQLTGDMQKDAYAITLMNGVGAVPFDDNGYPTKDVHCSIVVNDAGQFLANYNNIIPGTINIDNMYTDDGNGKLINKETKTEIGTIDYNTGLFTFTITLPNKSTVEYQYDIYNLEYMPNTAKFEKSFVEVFADLYALDVNCAVALNEFKGLNLKDNIENIIPQVLAQQIDQHIMHKLFKQAELQMVGNFDSSVTPTTYTDFGSYLCQKMGEYITNHGVTPNVIICNGKGFGCLSQSIKFTAAEIGEHNYAGTPKLAGYFNNAKVFVTNTTGPDVVLTYKGDSDAQASCVYAPFIPVTLRTVNGMESGGMIVTTNAYSIGGFAVVNPGLIEGIRID